MFSSAGTASTAENAATTTAVYTAVATDADGTSANNTVSYTLSSGGDNDLFDIDATTGAVTFKASPNFEAPADVGGNNQYDIVVHALDNGSLHDVTKAVAITVTDLPPSEPADGNAAADEVSNGAAAGTGTGIDANSTDPAGGTVTYALLDDTGTAADGGSRFAISASTGVVTVSGSVPIVYDSVTPANNDITITVRASDPSGAFTSHDFVITVTPNAPPTITAGATLSYVENDFGDRDRYHHRRGRY